LTASDTLVTREDISQWAEAIGFAAIGITDIDLSEHAPHVKAWLQKGFAGDMGYLERNLAKRLNPELLEPQTCRVITARMNYLTADTKPLEVLADSSTAYVSRYALGRDYHKVLRRRLAKLAEQINDVLPGHRYRAFTDSAPVLEKALAEKSGLGWIGKHTLLLNKDAGSWFFLGEIYTNAPLPIDVEATQPDTQESGCGKCSACMTVCPTGAIIAPNQLDARRCISYLTIEHKGIIDEALRPLIGNRVYGCDDCQLFCPWNRDAPHSSEVDFAPRNGLEAASLLDLFDMDATEFDRMTRGSAIRRINFDQWQRNLAIAIGNGDANDAALTRLTEKLTTASPMVRVHIEWAINELNARASD